MGYLAVFIVGVFVLVVLVIAATHNRKPKQGRISGEGTAILRDQPSADEPTPARSVTASSSEIRKAEKHTPPA
jgi:hypothetical protein